MTDDLRWREAWYFLSLDRVRPFVADLWLHDSGERDFAQLARAAVERELKNGDSALDVSRLNYSLLAGVAQDAGDLVAARLAAWVQSVFVRGPADRQDESQWSLVINDVPPWFVPTIVTPPWLLPLMDSVRQGKNAVRERVRQNLKSVGETPPSGWDQEVSDAFGYEIEGTDSTVALITGLNAFSDNWEDFCGRLGLQELEEVAHWGRHVVETKNLPFELSFPGAWRWEHLTFLRRALRV
jgi:hypothetical protein